MIKNNNVYMFEDIMRIHNSREAYVKYMITDIGCEEFLRQLILEKQVYDMLVSLGSNSYVAAQKREYIIYELLYILNELKPIPAEQLLVYILNPDTILTEVIGLMQEEKGWRYDKHAALDFCRCMVSDYVHGEGSVAVDCASAPSSLEQIVGNYEEYMLEHRIGDKCSMDLYDNQLNICDGGFYGMYSRDTRDLVKKLVVHRMHDKEIF